MSNLSEAISEMRNMRESYDQIGAAAEAYNTGKVQLAQNITSKGVPASAEETLPELAEKVSAIAQESYTIQGGEMYAKQLFGSLETPNYWNLYDVLAQLLSDGRLVQYGGILLAEYYRGYDSLALSGAGSGGAYVVSDLDENGQFKMYTSDTTHVWATEFDGKGNRWVAYCFTNEYHDFQITDTNTSPRSIFIGREVGIITSLVDSRISQIVTPDVGKLKDFDQNGKNANFGKEYILRNISLCTTNKGSQSSNTELAYYQIDELAGGVLMDGMPNLMAFILDCKKITNSGLGTKGILYSSHNLSCLCITGVEECPGVLNLGGVLYNGVYEIFGSYPLLKSLEIENTEELNLYIYPDSSADLQALKVLHIGYKTNDKSKTIRIYGGNISSRLYFEDVVLQEEWCKPLDIALLNKLTEANMYAHILQRLKQDEPDCGDGVTITLGTTNLAKLTSEESVQLLDDLTNIYGYTFA